jgi:hypothetical protein
LLRQRHLPIYSCLSVCLPDCLSAADPSVYASISICLQSCRLTSLGSSVPMCDLRVQRRLFLPQHFQHSFFCPNTLAFLLQCFWGMPCGSLLRCRTCHPKLAHRRRAWCLGGARFLGLKFAQVPGQADVSPQCAKNCVKNVCIYIYNFFPPLGFAHALCCNQKASHAVLGNLERSSCVHRCFDRTHQASASKLTLISTSPKSLLTDGDPRACCLELTTNFQSGSK